ncbi:MAG TPA: hypothetical protein VFT90_11945 [Chryseosolibacter sp.]|nr:hypothetical protein [Chryseosolibacter sp.]
MKGGLILLLTIIVASRCSNSREIDHSSISNAGDSIALLTSKYKSLEKAIWEYYTSIEEDVSKDLGVSETEIINRVQAMIDNGYIQKPLILVITEDGPKWAAVDYLTYKEYMTSNAVVLRRFYGTQPDILDTVFMDSIRTSLLKALHE